MPNFDIAFFWVGQDISLPQILVRSARICFGEDMKIHQLTDMSTPQVAGVSECHRSELSRFIMKARVEAMAKFPLENPTLFLDADIVFVDRFDMPEISENEVIAVHRKKDGLINHEYPELYPEFIGKTFIQMMPYQFCFVYTKSRKFLADLRRRMIGKPERFLRWYGDQIVLKEAADSGEYVFHKADPDEFAFSIKAPLDRNAIDELKKSNGTKIVLVKGKADQKIEILGNTMHAMLGHVPLTA